MNLKTITLACAICTILQFCMVLNWTFTSLGYIKYNESLHIVGDIILMLLYISLACFFFTIYKNQK